MRICPIFFPHFWISMTLNSHASIQIHTNTHTHTITHNCTQPRAQIPTQCWCIGPNRLLSYKPLSIYRRRVHMHTCVLIPLPSGSKRVSLPAHAHLSQITCTHVVPACVSVCEYDWYSNRPGWGLSRITIIACNPFCWHDADVSRAWELKSDRHRHRQPWLNVCLQYLLRWYWRRFWTFLICIGLAPKMSYVSGRISFVLESGSEFDLFIFPNVIIS